MVTTVASPTKSALMVALQFPPYGASTGRLRTLSFVRHLPTHGWKPIVIAARPSAYPDIDERTMRDIPAGSEVLRAWGFDAARTFSIRGIYPRLLATPDRWNSWALGAVLAGLKAVRSSRPRVLWATFPVPSALIAALALRRLTGLPLVADLRDPLVYETWPVNEWDRRVYQWIERRIVHAAKAVVVTTPGAHAMYRARYPALPPDRFHVIANGTEDDAITYAPRQSERSGPVVLVHSGLMESPDRDPRAFFQALRLLRDEGSLPQRGLQVRLRASGSEARYVEAARAAGVDAIVELAPRVSRDEAVQEMLDASGLLIFQGHECNRQIPAKAYEYLASGRPMLGLTHAAGDTYSLMHGQWGVPYMADMNVPSEIASMLKRFFKDAEQNSAYVPPEDLRAEFARSKRAVELARLFDQVL